MSELSERDQRILDLAGQPYEFEGKREQDIRDLLDMSATRFWHIVIALLDDIDALEYSPQLVLRLRRIRDKRRHDRSAARLGISLR
jgi:hypothetical protein